MPPRDQLLLVYGSKMLPAIVENDYVVHPTIKRYLQFPGKARVAVEFWDIARMSPN